MLEKVKYERLRELASEKPYRGRVGNYWGWDSRRYGYKDFYVSGNTIVKGGSNPEPIYTLRFYKEDLVSIYPDGTAMFHKDYYHQGETTVMSGMCEWFYDQDGCRHLSYFGNSKRHGGFTHQLWKRKTDDQWFKKYSQTLLVKNIRYDVNTNKAVDKFHIVYRKKDRKRTKDIKSQLDSYYNQAKAWFTSMSYDNFLEERDKLSGVYMKEDVKSLLAGDIVKAFMVAGMKHSSNYYRTNWGNQQDIPNDVIEEMKKGMNEELYYVNDAMIEDVIDGINDKHKTSNREIEIRKG
jgi:hypothetical protein